MAPPIKIFCSVVLLFAALVGCDVEPQLTQPQSIDAGEFDGLSQACFDSVVRIRNRQGTGCGNATAYYRDGELVELASEATHVEIESNRHVAMDRGADQIVDVWYGGDLVASKRTKTDQSWFHATQSKDIATILISLEQLGGPLAVIPAAPYGEDVQEGDKIWTVGCSDGRHPRARCGNVLSVRNGLIYYDPKSIGGDSGGPVFKWSIDRQRFERVGRTAWAIKEGNRWVGLAMTQSRVDDIRSGRVSDGNWELPEGAVMLSTMFALPTGAVAPEDLQDGCKCDECNPPTRAEPVPMQCKMRPGWVFPIADGNPVDGRAALGRRGPVRRAIGNFGAGIFGLVRYAFWLVVLAVVLAVYIGPTILTPLKYDWPFKALQAVWSLLRPAAPILIIGLLAATAHGQCAGGVCVEPTASLAQVEDLPDLVAPADSASGSTEPTPAIPVAPVVPAQPMTVEPLPALPPLVVWPTPPIYELTPAAPVGPSVWTEPTQPASNRRCLRCKVRRIFRRK